MAQLLKNNLQELEKTLDHFCIGAANALEDESSESCNVKMLDSLKLLQSRILLLKAKIKDVKLTSSEVKSLPSSMEICGEFNNEVSKYLLQDLMWKSAMEFSVFNKYIANEATTKESHQQDFLMGLSVKCSEHTELVKKLQILAQEHSTICAKALQKAGELKQELHKYKDMLNTQEEQLIGKSQENDPTETETETKVVKMLERVNIARLVMINLLGVSGVDMFKDPHWAEILAKTRKPITMASLEELS